MAEVVSSGSTRKFVASRAKAPAAEMRTKAAVEIRERQSTEDVRLNLKILCCQVLVWVIALTSFCSNFTN